MIEREVESIFDAILGLKEIDYDVPSFVAPALITNAMQRFLCRVSWIEILRKSKQQRVLYIKELKSLGTADAMILGYRLEGFWGLSSDYEGTIMYINKMACLCKSYPWHKLGHAIIKDKRLYVSPDCDDKEIFSSLIDRIKHWDSVNTKSLRALGRLLSEDDYLRYWNGKIQSKEIHLLSSIAYLCSFMLGEEHASIEDFMRFLKLYVPHDKSDTSYLRWSIEGENMRVPYAWGKKGPLYVDNKRIVS